jgi:hypothetical protein
VKPNIAETSVGEQARERARRESVAVGKSEQIIVGQHRARNGSERTA